MSTLTASDQNKEPSCTVERLRLEMAAAEKLRMDAWSQTPIGIETAMSSADSRATLAAMAATNHEVKDRTGAAQSEREKEKACRAEYDQLAVALKAAHANEAALDAALRLARQKANAAFNAYTAYVTPSTSPAR